MSRKKQKLDAGGGFGDGRKPMEAGGHVSRKTSLPTTSSALKRTTKEDAIHMEIHAGI